MVLFLELPAELRQQSLLQALPNEIIIGSSDASPLRDFQLICRQFNADLQNLRSSYHATYILTHPIHTPWIRSNASIHEIKHIRLHAWFLTQLGLALDVSHIVPGIIAPTRSLSPWVDALAITKCKLPRRGLQSIELDINLAPNETRQHSRAWRTWLMNDSCNMDRIYMERAVSLAEIIRKLVVWMQVNARNQQPRLVITSSLTKKSQLWIPEVFTEISKARDLGLDVRFESDSLEDAHEIATLETAYEILQSACDSDPQRYRNGEPLNNLRVAFDSDFLARHLFRRCAAEDPRRTMRILFYFFEVARSWDHYHGTIGALTTRQRTLLIRLSELLGMTCELEGDHLTEFEVQVADLHVGFRERPQENRFARHIDVAAIKDKLKAIEEHREILDYALTAHDLPTSKYLDIMK